MFANRNSPACENPACRNRSWWNRFKPSAGIRLQSRWYCDRPCLESALLDALRGLARPAEAGSQRTHRMPLGLLMVSEGWISESDLREALAAQRTAEGGRIGEWMCRRGVATEQQVTSALSRQWARPVFSLEGNTHFLQYAGMIPLPLLEAAQMVPVHYLPQSQHLYVAFALGIDYSVLYGAEQMLSCRTEPCLAAQSSVRSALERIREQPRPPEIVFDGGQDLRETGQTILNYVAQLGAEQVRLARCGRHLWVRLQSAQQSTHLLFC